MLVNACKKFFFLLYANCLLFFHYNKGEYMASRVLMTKKPNVFHCADKLASEILSNHQDEQNLVLVGIKRRGADIATRICNLLEKRLDEKCHWGGKLDINLYRDDWTKLSGKAT